MYITINNIKGEKRIDLSYLIQNFDSDKEIAVIRMLSDNVQYQILKLRAVMNPISNRKKLIPSGTYAGRELLSMLEGIVELKGAAGSADLKISKSALLSLNHHNFSNTELIYTE